MHTGGERFPPSVTPPPDIARVWKEEACDSLWPVWRLKCYNEKIRERKTSQIIYGLQVLSLQKYKKKKKNIRPSLVSHSTLGEFPPFVCLLCFLFVTCVLNSLCKMLWILKLPPPPTHYLIHVKDLIFNIYIIRSHIKCARDISKDLYKYIHLFNLNTLEKVQNVQNETHISDRDPKIKVYSGKNHSLCFICYISSTHWQQATGFKISINVYSFKLSKSHQTLFI